MYLVFTVSSSVLHANVKENCVSWFTVINCNWATKLKGFCYDFISNFLNILPEESVLYTVILSPNFQSLQTWIVVLFYDCVEQPLPPHHSHPPRRIAVKYKLTSYAGLSISGIKIWKNTHNTTQNILTSAHNWCVIFRESAIKLIWFSIFQGK